MKKILVLYQGFVTSVLFFYSFVFVGFWPWDENRWFTPDKHFLQLNYTTTSTSQFDILQNIMLIRNFNNMIIVAYKYKIKDS